MVINVAVGGKSTYFPDRGNNYGKPWRNGAPFAMRDFWNGRQQWLRTWNITEANGNDSNLNADLRSSFQIDYVRLWAV